MTPISQHCCADTFPPPRPTSRKNTALPQYYPRSTPVPDHPYLASYPLGQDLYATTNRTREPGQQDYDVKSTNWAGSSTMVFSESAPG